jgi:outer membrane protein assembly factor BamA
MSPTRLNKILPFLWVLLLALVTSCSIERKIPEGEVYFKSHRIVLDDNVQGFSVSKDELLALSRLKPNRRILWTRLNLRFYTSLVPEKALERSVERANRRCISKNERRKSRKKSPKQCKSLWMWLAYTVGEQPALLDSLKVEKAAEQMNILLQKNGYFNNKVTPEIEYKGVGLLPWKKREKCEVIYHIQPGTPYRLRSIKYEIEDAGMARRKSDLLRSSLLDTNMVFNVAQLENERSRIADYFNNSGYYEFTKDYIVYDADSAVGNEQVDVVLRLKPQTVVSETNPEETIDVPHKKFFLRNIYINTNFSPTLESSEIGYDTIQYGGLYVLSRGKPTLRPSLLQYTTTIASGEEYKKEKIERTYKRFVTLGTARSVNIQIVPKAQVDSSGYYLLDAIIQITPAKKQALSFDPRVINRAGNMGIYGNIVYRHKNINRGAENLEIRIITGFEASQLLGQNTAGTDGTLQRNFNLNTFEIGPEVTLSVPRLFPFGYRNSRKSKDPHTDFKAIFNYQRRPDYERTLSQFTYGWSWIGNPDKSTRFNLDIAEFSIIQINRSQAFEDLLIRLNDSFLANSYRDHLILASSITYTLNTQKAKFQRQTIYYRSSFEGAGNALRAAFALSSAEQDAFGSYEIDNIRFAQYLKTEHDFRYFFNANERNVFVVRSYAGVGIPLKNFEVLPFEKSFFVGGANGLRAWQARTLGPGSFRDTTAIRTFNNIGDIKLEANFEYRFKITQMFQAALFADAGNIWLVNKDEQRKGAEFDPQRFISEIAIGAGAGVRLDFEYFLVRFDLGVPLKDPLKVPGERWAWQPKEEYNTFLNSLSSPTAVLSYRTRPLLNFGIGFPF